MNRRIMEKEIENGSYVNESNENGQIENMEINSSSTTSLKGLDLTKIPRGVVILVLSVILLLCIGLFGSYNNEDIKLFGSRWSFSSIYRLNGNSSSLLVQDEYKELRKVLEATCTKEKTVILTTLNEAWAKPNSIFDVFLESFRIGKNTSKLLRHMLIIAVDEKAFARCQETISHCYLFKSKSRSANEMANEAKFMTPIYMDMMWERLAFLNTILSLGYNFVFTDTDVMWFRDPFLHFDPNVDFQTSCDAFNGKPFDRKNSPNNGFIFVKSNSRTIKFYEFWVSSRKKYPGLHEQAVFNKIKQGSFVKKIGLTVKFMDTDYYGGFCSPSKDFNKVCTMHANCCVGLDRKIADLNKMLDDWKRFVSNVTNKAYWSVPYKCGM